MKKLNSYLNSARTAGVAAIALFGVAACHSPNEFPPVPPTPAGFIACIGHGNSYSDAGALGNNNYPLWYAFWHETADSTRATLIVGIAPNNIDTIYLGQDTSQTWHYVENDTIVPYSWAYVYATSDSVIEGTHGVDAGTFYYLKKLN